MRHPDRFTCEDVFRRLDDYLDRTLEAAELERLQEHLELCSSCASEFRFEESLLAEVRRKVGRIQAPADLMQRISSRLGTAGPTGEDDGPF